MSDSDDDGLAAVPPPAKRRKFAFKKLAQRIAEVDVDVYRQLKTVREEPLPGCTSFFQEELLKWRELNTAEHWLLAAPQLQQRSETLPQLLHHKDEIVDILLGSLTLEARLSAPPLFCLLGTLARDLQADYLPYVPRLLAHLAALVQQGAESEPELLQPAFECLALVCKHLVRRLAADLPGVLRASARLRSHHAPHVRRLTAATLAYLLRQATTVQLRVGVRTLLAECVVAPSEDRADGAGLLLAEAAKGVSHGLNSKAPQLLQLLLQRQLVSAAELSGKGKSKRQLDDEAVCQGVHTVAEAALGHLLEHVRRGKAQPLWDATLALADRELAGLDPSQPTGAELAAAARAVALVAQAAEFFRGSRVESYAPLFDLAARLCRPELLAAAAAAAEAGAAGEALIAATLRLLTAVLAGHSKEIGASSGMRAVRAHAAEWASVFSHVSGAPLVDFLGSLLRPPAGGAEVAALFAPQALEALAGRLLAGGREPGLHSRALAILLQYCRAAHDEEELPDAQPFLGACPSGARLVTHLKGLLKAKGVATSEAATAAAFCALGCLPYACSSAAEIATLCDGVVKRCEAGLAKASADANQASGALTLLAAALKLKARVLLRAAEQEPGGPAGEQLAAMRGVALRWLKAHPGAFVAVEAAAAVLTAAKQTGHQLGTAELEELLPALEGNLASRSQPLRRESLRVLVACEQPGGSDALGRLLRIESAPLAIEAGRPGAASLELLQAALEFGKVPATLLGAVVSALLGVLNIRLLLLWAPANAALAAALEHAAPDAATRVLAHLRAVQAAFLAGDGAAISPEEDAEEAGEGDAGLGEETAERALRRAADAGSPQRGSGATDASVRLNHLLQAVAKAPTAVLGRFSGDWVPLFLAHVAARSTGVDREDEEPAEQHEGVTQLSRIGGRAWRAHLKDWLAVVAAVKAPRNLRQAEQLRVAVASLLTDIDVGVQQATLKCLKAWKLKHVNEHLERLLRLVSNDTLREELTAFPLATSCKDGIAPEHRQGLVRVLTRVLWPKMRKRSGRLGGRGAPGSARAAVLNFLAAAQPLELNTLLQLVLQPVSGAFEPPPAAAIELQTTEDGLFEEPWWVAHLGHESAAFWLGVMQPSKLAAFEPRVKLGLLHSAEDLLQHLGHNMQPFLPELAVLLLALLESAQGAAGKEGGDTSAREVRAGSLRLLASLWTRFPAAVDFNALWPHLFAVMQPSVQRMPAEASANRAPPVLEVAAAFAASPALAPLLADRPSHAAATAEQLLSLLQAACPDAAWAAERCGSRLLGQVVAVLAAHTCGAASREVCLALLEDVLGYGEEPAGHLLAPHMAPLLDALRGIAVAELDAQPVAAKRLRGPGQKQKQPARAPGRGPAAARALAILEQLSALPCSRDLCDQLADALLPLLKRKSGKRAAAVSREAMLARVLNVLTIVWQRQAANGGAGAGSEEKLLGIADSIAPLAGEIEGARAATALAAAVQALAGLQASLRPAAELLAQLSALSATEVDAIDFDARLAAHRRLARGGWGDAAAGGGALLLVHRAFVDLRSGDDLAIRHAAAQALAALLPAAAPGEPVLRAVQANLRRGVAAANLAVRQEHLTLLRALGLRFPADYPDLRALADDDVEVDFFANVAHLQMHRRTRALQRLARLLEARRLGAGVLLQVATPLLAQMVVEGRAAEAAGHELKESDRDKEANVADAAVGVLGKLGAALAWPQYRQLMGQFLRSLQRHAATSKAVVRAVCAIIDAFHFPLPAEAAAAEPAADVATQPEQPLQETAAAEEGASDEETEADAEAEAATEAADQQEVLRWLTKRVLPALEAALVVEKGESVRAPVALAIVKLVRRLPPAAARAVLPRVLQGVANLLKHRAQRIRDDARAVLAAMAAELGPPYLPFLLDVLESALPEKGYLGHVKGYSLHFLLEALAKDAEPGAFDETLPRVLELIERQLFGEAAEEREAGAFAGVREGRKSRANDTYQLLAQCITFRTQLAALLEPVRCRLAEAASPAIRTKLTALLEAASRGVAANASATPQDTLVFVSGVLQSVTAAEQAAVARAEAAAAAASRGEGVDPQQQQEAAAARHQHLLLQFALGLLLRALKKGALGGRSPEAAAMLDPLLPALVQALRSRHAPVVELSLRVLGHLVQLPLPGLASAAPAAGDAMADLMRAAPDAGGRVPQECLRLLAALLRACPQWAPRTAQLRFLLTWAFADVAAAAAATGAFTLLKAVIKRRLLLPEVYDVMDRVQDLMIKSQSQTARQLCSSTLLQFLLDYPLGAKRFQQHLHFLLANLAFEHEAGRLAALDLLTVLLGKLPPELLAAHASVVFVPLVARLPADPSPRCRKEAAGAIQSLVKLVPPEQARALLGFCAEWLAGGDARLQAAAAQALGLMAEAQGEAFGRAIRPQLPRLAELLASHAAEEADAGEALQDGEEGGAQQAWQEAYQVLVLLTKLARACPAQLRWREPAARPLWRVLPGLLLHRHLWVRKLAADALGLAFADAAVWEGLLADAECGADRLAALLYLQLEAPEAREAGLAQSAKCLVFLAPHLRPPGAAGEAEAAAAEAAADADSGGEEAEAAAEAPAAAAAGSLERLSLIGLVRRVAKLADDRSFPRRTARLTALRLLAALASRLGPEGVAPLLPLMLRPLFRISEGLSPNPPEVRELAAEVLGHLRQAAGADALAAGLNEARRGIAAARAERRRQAAVRALVDPGASARAKLQKQARKAAGKKRKMDEVARLRGAGLPAKNKRRKEKPSAE